MAYGQLYGHRECGSDMTIDSLEPVALLEEIEGWARGLRCCAIGITGSAMWRLTHSTVKPIRKYGISFPMPMPVPSQ